VKRGLRFVRGGEIELIEKLGRRDPCPCGSGQSFQALLPSIGPVSTGPSAPIIGGSEGSARGSPAMTVMLRRGCFARSDWRADRQHFTPMIKQRIVIDPAVCADVRSSRVRACACPMWLDALSAGASMTELVDDFPYLVREDIFACLAYGARAVDHAVVQAA